MSKQYWNIRYAKGIGSGPGSIGSHKEWKWNEIDSVVPERIDDILDLGCGDHTFMEGRSISKYTGIDRSEVVINKNKELYPDKTFIVGDISLPLELKSKFVFCMDVLIHVKREWDYYQILNNLSNCSTKWIITYTWRRTPFKTWRYIKGFIRRREFKQVLKAFFTNLTTDGKYQYYRNLDEEIEFFRDKGFELFHRKPTPRSINPYAVFHIFKKIESDKIDY